VTTPQNERDECFTPANRFGAQERTLNSPPSHLNTRKTSH
jgi:hypothetical protein